MNTKTSIEISIIIPFYKELHLITNAVKSVFLQEKPNNTLFEIVIGNDSNISEDEIRTLFSDEENFHIKIAKNSSEKGAGNARNSAIIMASKKFGFDPIHMDVKN